MAPADSQLIDLGTFEGGALAALCYGGDDERALGVVTAPDRSPALQLLEDLGVQPPLITHKIGETVPSLVESGVGLVFSDTINNVRRLEETKLWATRVGKHGIMALHIHIGPNSNSVRQIADEVCKGCWEELEQAGMVIAFRRK